MKKWLQYQLLKIRCLAIRIKHHNELFTLVFSDTIPDLGQIMEDAHGTSVMIVNTGYRDGNTWVVKGYVAHVPEPVSPPTAVPIDFIPDRLPPGLPVMMNNNMWVKLESGDYVLQFVAEEIKA